MAPPRPPRPSLFLPLRSPSLSPPSSPSSPPPSNLFNPQTIQTHNETKDDFLRRFEELSADIDQLRLQIQRGTNTPSSTTSTVTTTPHPPELRKFFSYGPTDRRHLPCLGDISRIDSVFKFLTKLEQEFGLRNHELQLPADSTEGWAQYGLQQLRGAAETRALAKWGISPNISWETFKEWLIKTFCNERVVRNINSEYTTLKHYESGGMMEFNTRFLELRLLLSFVGKEMTEEAAIRDYQEKIAWNQKLALALAQFTTVERICERDPKLTLEEVMDYCYNVYQILEGESSST